MLLVSLMMPNIVIAENANVNNTTKVEKQLPTEKRFSGKDRYDTASTKR